LKIINRRIFNDTIKRSYRKNIDYKIKKMKREDGGSGGHNFEVITLTPEAAKKLCLSTKSKIRIQVHQYFLDIEVALYKYKNYIIEGMNKKIKQLEYNQKTKEVLRNAYVTITSSSDTGKIILKTDESGSYKLRLKSKTDYELFSAKQYFFDSKVFYQTTKGLEVSTDLVQDIDLIPMDLNSTFTLEGIYYDLDKADLRPASRLILDTLVMTLNKYPNVRIELGSHTDCRADSSYNINLSQRRADSAVAYIISKGIDSLRIVSKGYGENQLVNGCACEGPNEAIQGRKCSEEEHQLNRRTTVKFLDLNYTPPVKVDPAAPKTAPGKKPGQPALRPGQPRR
jgi:outer membrane protein OmpA-like peptidoglycan-associated protein